MMQVWHITVFQHIPARILIRFHPNLAGNHEEGILPIAFATLSQVLTNNVLSVVDVH